MAPKRERRPDDIDVPPVWEGTLTFGPSREPISDGDTYVVSECGRPSEAQAEIARLREALSFILDVTNMTEGMQTASRLDVIRRRCSSELEKPTEKEDVERSPEHQHSWSQEPTPGPWRVALDMEAGTWSVFSGLSEKTIAEGLTEADARLIGEAPSMAQMFRMLTIEYDPMNKPGDVWAANWKEGFDNVLAKIDTREPVRSHQDMEMSGTMHP